MDLCGKVGGMNGDVYAWVEKAWGGLSARRDGKGRGACCHLWGGESLCCKSEPRGVFAQSHRRFMRMELQPALHLFEPSQRSASPPRPQKSCCPTPCPTHSSGSAVPLKSSNLFHLSVTLYCVMYK